MTKLQQQRPTATPKGNCGRLPNALARRRWCLGTAAGLLWGFSGRSPALPFPLCLSARVCRQTPRRWSRCGCRRRIATLASLMTAQPSLLLSLLPPPRRRTPPPHPPPLPPPPHPTRVGVRSGNHTRSPYKRTNIVGAADSRTGARQRAFTAAGTDDRRGCRPVRVESQTAPRKATSGAALRPPAAKVFGDEHARRRQRRH